MQKIQVIGRIGKDAEVKDFGNSQVINFSVAVSEKYTNKQTGEVTTNTTWFECAKWGNNTSIAQYIKKGGQIFVEGKINNRAWVDQSGTPQVTNGINVFEIELLGSKDDNQTPQQQQQRSPSNAPVIPPVNEQPFEPSSSGNEEEHDDLPF
jgi:single-strand DNA-binding protein